ncbi:carbon-nitrogen hydrolase [Photobacterium jeanii]|uniref:Carbon-nitrogen hydrolase n=1 Tax=Photobacterium jeanii TaxID=858640 RepID=A0A178KL72_9GAMM|nr:carbon-nitrogen hydrolase family protein [Photobacterium jeanii]OAN17990.1 carbon-nitrogen hydrolase [Photobacterium jeanii]PST92340.1 carbon-nitrogen hydrolase family protein [Photobacterium jeanii]
MNISIVQMDVVYKNKAENIAKLSNMLEAADKVGELVLLPELFSTGYIFNSPEEIHALCEDYTNSLTITALTQLASAHNTTIVAGVAEVEDNQYFNSIAVVDKHGLQHKYRKISQTNIDRQYFSRGDSLLTFKHHGLVFGVAVCFDLWFPEIIRPYAELGIDVLLHPANFGGPYSLHVSRSRAIENSMHVATCNRIGKDITKELSAEYCGSSQLCTPNGEYLVQFAQHEELVTVDILGSHIENKKVIGVDLLSEIRAITQQLRV